MKKQKFLLPGILTLCILLAGALALAASIPSFFGSNKADPATGSDSLSQSGLSSAGSGPADSNAGTGSFGLKVFFFNVGQADAILVILPNGKTLAIDAGESDTQKSLADRIKTLGITRLDALVATHPHTDHIGGMSYLIKKFDAGTIYMSKASTTTKTFENLLETIADKKIQVIEAKTGGSISLDADVAIRILSPAWLSDDDINDNSVVLKITYGQTSFLLMGDAGTPIEKQMLLRKENLEADVLKVGHHGSDTSTSDAFLKEVMPKIAVISVGKDNDYNHPSQTVVDRLKGIGAQILRTDEQGTVILSSDGKTVKIQSK